MNRALMPQLSPGKRHPDWYSLYEGAAETALPWFCPALDPDVKREVLGFRPPARRILEVGCGLGNQAHLLRGLGCEVTATDISPAAVMRARRAYPEVNFLVDDITRTTVPEKFELVVDRGCFHVLEREGHAGYLESVHRLLQPMGVLLLKVLSSEQGKGEFGPQRFSMLGLIRIFEPRFEVLKIRRAVYQGSMPTPPKAWFAVMRRKELPRGEA